MTNEEKAALLQWLDRMIKKAEQDERVAGRSPYALYWTGKASALNDVRLALACRDYNIFLPDKQTQ